MTTHEERFTEHVVFQSLTNLDDRLAEAEEAAAQTSGSLLAHSRLVEGAQYIRSQLLAVHPSLVAFPAVDAIQQSIEAALGNLAQFASSDDLPQLDNAWTHVQDAINSSVRLPKVASDGGGDAQEAVARFRRSVAQYIRRIEDEATQASTHVAELAARTTEAAGRVAELEATFEGATKELATNLEAEKGRIKAELQSAIAEGEALFPPAVTALEEAAKERFDKKEAQFEGTIKKLSSRADTALQHADQAVAGLEERLATAEELVGVLARTSLSGAYLAAANDAHNRATKWLLAAIALAILAVIGAGYLLFIHDPPTGGFGVADTIRRGIFAVVLFIPATICFGEARDNRTESLRARDLGAQLTSIGPFMSDLPDEAQQQLLQEVADRFFVGGNLVQQESQPRRRMPGRALTRRDKET